MKYVVIFVIFRKISIRGKTSSYKIEMIERTGKTDHAYLLCLFVIRTFYVVTGLELRTSLL